MDIIHFYIRRYAIQVLFVFLYNNVLRGGNIVHDTNEQ